MSEEIIDLKDVLERVQGDKELLEEVFDVFQEDFVQKRRALGKAMTAHDIAQVEEIIHSMKGSSSNISAGLMYAACLKLEALAQEGKTDGMPEAVSQIDGCFEKIKVFIARFKKDLGTH